MESAAPSCRSLLMLAVLAFVVLGLAPCSVAERPNIVLFFTDDQRADAVGYAGNDAIRTPNLDRLARRYLLDQGIALQ